jgi:hypothetical protein
MALHLVIHRPEAPPDSGIAAAIRAALIDAAWEIADSHWSPTAEALLVSTDLSAAYLVAHFRAGLARRGHDNPGMLLVTPVTAAAAWCGLPQDGEEWIRGLL